MPLLQVDLSDPEDVASGIEVLVARREAAARSAIAAAGGYDAAAAAELMVDNLMARLGPKLRAVLETVASKPEGSEYTVESLAKELGRKTTSLRAAMNAPLKKSWNAVAAEVPGAPEIFDFEWRGDRFHFRMEPEVRAAILGRKKKMLVRSE